MSIFWLVLGLALLVILAMKGLPIIIVTWIVGAFLLVTSGIGVYEGFTGIYMAKFGDYAKNYALIFFFGALFGKLCEVSGATDSIAKTMIKWFGEKHVVTAIILTALVLGFGGVSVFVAMFALFPLAMSMFEKADISRDLFPGAYIAGGGTIAMTAPFAPSIQNIMPTKYLGTDTTVGALPGIIGSIFVMVACIIYMNKQVAKYKEKGHHYVAPKGIIVRNDVDQENLPSFFLSVLPMIILIVSLNVLKLPAETALLTGVIGGLVCYFKWLPKKMPQISEHIKNSFGDGTMALVNTCSTVAFGAIASSTLGYAAAIPLVTGIGGGGLVAAGITTTVMAGLAGSASGGLGIALPIAAEQFLPLGVDPGALHRVCAIACSGLDSLPHNGCIVTTLNYSQVEFKDGYKHIFMVSVVFTLIELVLVLGIFKAMGY